MFSPENSSPDKTYEAIRSLSRDDHTLFITLYAAKGPLGVQELAHQLKDDVKEVSKRIAYLENEGLVYFDCPFGSFRPRGQPTAKGYRLTEQAKKAMEEGKEGRRR